MIWALVREQLRSQGRFNLWTGIVIAVTVGVAAYGALFTIVVVDSAANIDHVLGHDREHTTDSAMSMPGDYPAADQRATPYDDVTRAVDSAVADGADPVAVVTMSAVLPGPWTPHLGSQNLVALHGNVDWSAIVVEGEPPGPGEMVVNAEYAKNHGLSVGDSVSPGTEDWAAATGGMSINQPLTISGLSHSSTSSAAVDLWVPGGYVAWADVPLLQNATLSAVQGAPSNSDEATSIAGLALGWDGNAPSIEVLPNLSYVEYSLGFGGNTNNSASLSVIPIMATFAVGALVLGSLVMAFALGRAQADARSRWVATARALGVPRRQVLLASLVESGVVGIIAGALGYALGTIGATLHVAYAKADVVSPVLNGHVSFNGWVALAALTFGTTLALVIGAVPAILAARVTPASALKPVLPPSAVATSPRIPLTTLGIVLSASVALLAIRVYLWFEMPRAIAWLGVLLATGSGLMLASAWLGRALRRSATAMTRSRRVSVMVAGDAILARARLFAIPALLAALSLSLAVGVTLPLVAKSSADAYEWNPQLQAHFAARDLAAVAWVSLGICLISTLLCVVIWATSGIAAAREASAREALGLSRHNTRRASAIAYLVTQAQGLALGLVAGLVVGLAVTPLFVGDRMPAWTHWACTPSLVPVIATAVAACCAAAGAVAAYATASVKTPLSQLESAA